MWEWLDQIMNTPEQAPDYAGSFDQWGSIGTPVASGIGGDGYIPADLANYAATTGDVSTLSQYLPNVPKFLLQAVARNGEGAINKLIQRARPTTLWQQVKNDPAGTAFSTLPFWLAKQQADQQAGDLNGVISKMDPSGPSMNSILNPFDAQTSALRGKLQGDLQQRGLSGSVFGDQTLTNFDSTRSMGRNDIQQLATQPSLNQYGKLLTQRNTNRNMLLGAGLNASANLFGMKDDVFGLGNIT